MGNFVPAANWMPRTGILSYFTIAQFTVMLRTSPAASAAPPTAPPPTNSAGAFLAKIRLNMVLLVGEAVEVSEV
jgi:hypothetical protein